MGTITGDPAPAPTAGDAQPAGEPQPVKTPAYVPSEAWQAMQAAGLMSGAGGVAGVGGVVAAGAYLASQAARERDRGEVRCSFCGKGRREVMLIQCGRDGHNICDECVEIAYANARDVIKKRRALCGATAKLVVPTRTKKRAKGKRKKR